MLAKYLPPVAASARLSFTRILLLVVASSLASPAFAQATDGPSPAAAAANADMVSWMARGLLSAVVLVAVLTSIVLVVVFTTSRRPDSRPLAPAQVPQLPAQQLPAAAHEALAPEAMAA